MCAPRDQISDVVLKNAESDVGAINERHLCALNYGKHAGFEVIHGLLDRIMEVLAVPFSEDESVVPRYTIEESNGARLCARRSSRACSCVSVCLCVRVCTDAAFFPGRQAHILLNGETIGNFGIVHPVVIKNFNLGKPCTYIEMNIEPFLIEN